jgi:hypothetical protein
VCGGWQELKFVFRPSSDGANANVGRVVDHQTQVPQQMIIRTSSFNDDASPLPFL